MTIATLSACRTNVVSSLLYVFMCVQFFIVISIFFFYNLNLIVKENMRSSSYSSIRFGFVKTNNMTMLQRKIKFNPSLMLQSLNLPFARFFE